MIKKLISLLLLLVWVAFVWIFAFPEQTQKIATSIWLWDLFNQIKEIKSWLDNSVRDSEKIMDDVTSKLTDTSEDLKKKALEIKEKAEKQAQNILNTK